MAGPSSSSVPASLQPKRIYIGPYILLEERQSNRKFQAHMQVNEEQQCILDNIWRNVVTSGPGNKTKAQYLQIIAHYFSMLNNDIGRILENHTKLEQQCNEYRQHLVNLESNLEELALLEPLKEELSVKESALEGYKIRNNYLEEKVKVLNRIEKHVNRDSKIPEDISREFISRIASRERIFFKPTILQQILPYNVTSIIEQYKTDLEWEDLIQVQNFLLEYGKQQRQNIENRYPNYLDFRRNCPFQALLEKHSDKRNKVKHLKALKELGILDCAEECPCIWSYKIVRIKIIIENIKTWPIFEYNGKIIELTPQKLLDFGFLATVIISHPEQVDFFGRKIRVLAESLFARGFEKLVIDIKSIPYKPKGFNTEPTVHKILIRPVDRILENHDNFLGFYYENFASEYVSPFFTIKEQIQNWRKRGVANNLCEKYSSDSNIDKYTLITEDAIQKIYSNRYLPDILFNRTESRADLEYFSEGLWTQLNQIRARRDADREEGEYRPDYHYYNSSPDTD